MQPQSDGRSPPTNHTTRLRTSAKTLPSNKAVLYARVSSKEQQREGYSIPAQCKLLRSYAERHNYQIVGEFIDVETAKQSGRTNFTKMIDFLKEHPDVKTILCEKTDRLYRNFKDYVTIDELDFTLVFVKEGSVLNKHSRSHEKFIHGIKVLMAKNYIDNLSEETRKGLREKAEQGSFPGTAPLGYRHNKEKKTIEIDEERAPLIRWMFEQYATGRFSLRDLEVMLAQKGLRNRRGNRLHRSSIALLLKNPFYIGDFLWTGKRYHGNHPPLIEKDLFDRAQAVTAKRNDTRSNAHRFAYTGLLKCAHCGSSVTAEIKKDRYIYYHCTFDKGSCGGSYVREEELERQFNGIFAGFQFPEAIVEWVREALRQSRDEQATFHKCSIDRLRAEHDKLQNRIDQIYLDKLDGEIEDAFYKRCVTQWREEQTKLHASIQRHVDADQNYIEQGIQLLDLAQNARDIFRHNGEAERTELLRFVMPNSTLEHDTVKPVFTPPFNIIHQLAEDARAVEAAVVADSPDAKRAASLEAARLILLPRVDSNFSGLSLRQWQ